MKIEIPEFCLIAMVGVTSSGKSAFAGKHFKEEEILSSDAFRRMVSDDENDQSVTADAFELLYAVAEKRLSHRKTTVIDATNLRKDDRKKITELAKSQDVHTVAIVMDLPEKTILQRNAGRADRSIPEKKVRSQMSAFRQGTGKLKEEGFRFVYFIKSEEEADDAEIAYTKLWNDRKDEHGPFDIIGDVHGCAKELKELLGKLGYVMEEGIYRHPEERTAVFVGDLCDRGPENMAVLRLVMPMVKAGYALCVPGNHDNKLERYLNNRNVQISYGLKNTIEEIENENDDFREEIRDFLRSLVSHYILDDGRLVVSHAGIRQEYIGRASARIREFCLYGDTTGETDDLGLPVRLDWAEDYRGSAVIVYGHTPQADVKVLNNTFCIDTGCVFGGKLSCLRYPEKEIVSVQAEKEYYKPVRPLMSVENDNDMLKASDITGKLRITTSLIQEIVIPKENTAAAFETVSRFAADPHWLIYLPPTMSPCETSQLDDYLEHPAEAFSYYKKNGVSRVVCEKKHMGSRAVVVLCHSPEAAAKRFGVRDGSRGIIYTRTGRRFFDDPEMESGLLDRIDAELTDRYFWDDFDTEWVCLDTEIMPWSEKAKALLKEQYGPVGRAGREALRASISAIEEVFERGISSDDTEVDLSALLGRYQDKLNDINKYVEAYHEYCWGVKSLEDIRIAPFHLLASEGRCFCYKTHEWHLDMIGRYMVGRDIVIMTTDNLIIDIDDGEQTAKAIGWWKILTESGDEGMVVKPERYVTLNGGHLIQPAVKCRGREYLRMIYGPEYLSPEHLSRLKKRSLSCKRSLALREFALGFESLNRFVKREPLYRVHECVFGVLALESEPVDPRL